MTPATTTTQPGIILETKGGWSLCRRPRFPRLARLAFRALGMNPVLLDATVMFDGHGIALVCDREKQPKLRVVSLYRFDGVKHHLVRLEISP
jgi:hypothetical protein